jgi:hypothetical protein
MRRGCSREERATRFKLLVGQKFGRLTVVEIPETISAAGNTIYSIKCLCECGKTTTPTEEKLVTGATISCGCFRKERMRKAFFARKSNKKTREMTIEDWK